MAEVIGGVSVSITGDVSQLNAALGSAVNIAGAAGGKVAGAFNTGAAAADQFSAATAAATAAEGEFAGATETANAALGHQISQLQATSGAIRTALGEQSIRAAERFLTMIPGLGAALQVAFPVIGAVALFEAISRVVGKSEELKAALKEQETQAEATNKADEELVRTLDRIGVAGIGRQFGGAAEATAQANLLKAQAQDVGNEILGIESKIRGLKAQTTGKLIGGPSADVVAAQVAAEEDKINQALDKQQGLYAQAGQAALEAGQKRQTQAGQLSSAQIAQQESVNAHLAALNKAYSDESIEQTHSAVQLQIAAMHDRESAAVSTAAEELRVAQAKEQAVTQALASEVPKRIALIRAAGAAEAAGKSEPAQTRTGVETQTKVGDFQTEADQKALAAHAETVKAKSALDIAQADRSRQVAEQLAAAWERSYDAITKAAKETSDAISTGVERQLQAQLRVAEIQDKGAGDVGALEIQRQKIALERAYGLESSHSATEQIAQARSIAALDAQERAQKLASAEAQLKDAEAATGTVRDQERIASLTADIATLKQKNANADAASALAIDQQTQKLTQQLTLEEQIAAAKNAAAGTYQQQQRAIGTNLGNEIGALPQQVGNDLGNSISDALLGHHPGKSIGQEMAKAVEDSLKNTAKKLVGDLLSAGFQEIFGKIKNAISPPAAQTGGAVGAPTGGGGVTAGATIPAGLPGAGVPIYGQGQPPAQNQGDAQQLAQINASLQRMIQAETACPCAQTTNALLGQMVSAGHSQSASLDKISATLLTSLSIQTAMVIWQALLYFKPSVLGTTYASGTDSAPGGMALVGEKGPEIVNLPRGSQVIPNHAIKGYANGTSYSSTAFQTGSTNLHFHAHGMSNPDKFIDHVMRKLPDALKARSSAFSPYSK